MSSSSPVSDIVFALQDSNVELSSDCNHHWKEINKFDSPISIIIIITHRLVD